MWVKSLLLQFLRSLCGGRTYSLYIDVTVLLVQVRTESECLCE